MPIVEFDGPPSWPLDASETGESTKSHGKIGDCEQLQIALEKTFQILPVSSAFRLQSSVFVTD